MRQDCLTDMRRIVRSLKKKFHKDKAAARDEKRGPSINVETP